MTRDPAVVARMLDNCKRRSAKRRGDAAERIVAIRLVMFGFACIELVATPTKSLRGVMTYTRRVMGDIKAVECGTGRAVLVEVKSRHRTLSLSDLAPHQVAALDQYVKHGARSILAWVNDAGVSLIPWPIDRAVFSTGKPLTIDAARRLELTINRSLTPTPNQATTLAEPGVQRESTGTSQTRPVDPRPF